MTESKKLNSFPNRSMGFDRQSLIAIDRGKITSKSKTISANSSQTHEMTIAVGQSGLISLPQKTVRKTSETISEFKRLEPLVKKAVLPSMEIAYLVSSSIQVESSNTLTRLNKILLGMGLGSGIALIVYLCDFLLYPSYSPTYLFSLNILQAIALLGVGCGLLSIIVGEPFFKKFATTLGDRVADWFYRL